MIAIPEHRLDALLHRHALVERELATDLKPEDYVKLSREFSDLTPVIDTIKEYRAVVSELADLETMMADQDADMRRMAEAEKPALQEKREQIEKKIRLA